MARTLLIICLWMLFGCAEEADEGPGQPASILAFPSSVTLTPETADVPQRLLVVSSNFNLRYRSGLLHAFDREALDRLVDDALAAECPGGEGSCLPVGVPNMAPALVGAVEIGDFGGEVVAVPLPGGPVRAFVPVRGSQSVIAADLDADRIRCAAGGSDCRGKGLAYPRPDPYASTVALGRLYVGHNTLGRDDEKGVLGTLPVEDDAWTRGRGGLSTIAVADSALGGVTSGACREEGGVETCTVFATGRAIVDGRQQVVAFDVTADSFQAGPLLVRNLFAQQRGTDSRGAALASGGELLYFASRFPDALARVDVTRLPELPSDGCILPEGDAPEGACPDLPPPSEERARFATVGLSPAPEGPNVVRVIPRGGPGEEANDLVALTTSESLAFYDGRTASLVANLKLGAAPSDLAFRERDGGLRLYVPSFGQATLAVVDIPDPLRPEGARVVAVLGRVQEEGF